MSSVFASFQSCSTQRSMKTSREPGDGAGSVAASKKLPPTNSTRPSSADRFALHSCIRLQAYGVNVCTPLIPCPGRSPRTHCRRASILLAELHSGAAGQSCTQTLLKACAEHALKTYVRSDAPSNAVKLPAHDSLSSDVVCQPPRYIIPRHRTSLARSMTWGRSNRTPRSRGCAAMIAARTAPCAPATSMMRS